MTIENLVHGNSLEIKANEENNTLRIDVRGDRDLFVINTLEYEAEDGDELWRVLDIFKAMFATVRVEFTND